MAKSATPPPGDGDKKIADADWLMRESSKANPKSKSKARPASPGAPGAPEDDQQSYDLAARDDDLFTVDEPESPPLPVPVPVPVPPPDEPKRKRKPNPKLDSEWDV